MKFLKLYIAMVISTSVAPPVGAVEIIHLNNGDKITGTLLGVKDGALRLETEYAGEVLIKRDQVVSIESDRPLAVQLEDGARYVGELDVEDESTVVEADGGAQEIAPSSIAYIAPDVSELEEAIKDANRKWTGFVDSGLTLRHGQEDTLDVVTSLQFKREVPSNALTLKLEGAYGETDDTLSTQRARGSTKWEYFPKDARYYYYLQSILEHDETRQLDFRGTAGGGFGYKFIENDRRNLDGEIGLEYAYERWENFGRGERRDLLFDIRSAIAREFIGLLDQIAAGTRTFDLRTAAEAGRLLYTFRNPDIEDEYRYEDHLNMRLHVHYDQKIFKESTLSEDFTILPKLDDLWEFRAINEFAFTSPLSDALSFRVSLRNEYDSDPGPDIDELDTIFVTGLRWDFKP